MWISSEQLVHNLLITNRIIFDVDKCLLTNNLSTGYQQREGLELPIFVGY